MRYTTIKDQHQINEDIRDREVRVISETGEQLGIMSVAEALRLAEKFILLDYFIIAHGKMWKEILTILMEKAEMGVQIRIIYDDFGFVF